ncbi:hypothetical protein EYF80_060057 [Liparis tanakae]|uniref:Uncharacterized protein n=1 Tax=Liparis tanakae TaxID=230148 RepID=A0A4Z2ELZ8_9TELE|nr:hypothetical protein EYF80_060057 [Liparis tanakae]
MEQTKAIILHRPRTATDSKIKRARSSSEMSSNRLNSSAVVKYSRMDVSARAPAPEKRPALNFYSL